MLEVLNWSGEKISKIVIVDDASDAPEHVADYSKVLIHRNSSNSGYARSLDTGMNLFTEEIILILDCDAYPLMDLVPAILKHFQEEPRLGAMGLFEVNAAGKTRIAGEYEPTLLQLLLGQALADILIQKGWLLGKRFVLHSCCMAVRREAFEAVKGFDEDFDFLDADTDFSMRLMDAGWLIDKDSRLKCFHKGSGSPQSTALRVLRYHRNRWLLLRKHHKIRFAWLFKLVLLVRHVAEYAILKIQIVLRGEIDLQMHAKVQSRRTLLQSVMNDYET